MASYKKSAPRLLRRILYHTRMQDRLSTVQPNFAALWPGRSTIFLSPVWGNPHAVESFAPLMGRGQVRGQAPFNASGGINRWTLALI
jgi:hypothetical protein